MKPLFYALFAIVIALALFCEVEAGPYNCGPNGCGPAYGRRPVARAAGQVRARRPILNAITAPFRVAKAAAQAVLGR